MSAVSEIITQDQIEDLWGCGYTIVARSRHPDPFYVPPDMVPQGRAYQWWHLVHDQVHFRENSGWAPVPASRHDGYFMPFGHTGAIEVQGLGLFEKPKFEVEEEQARNVASAHRLIDDWVMKATRHGLVGSFSMGGDVHRVDESKTIETTVSVPSDMMPHMSAIFSERDRLKDEMVLPDRSLKPGPVADKFYAMIAAYPAASWWPTLHAILLPIAVENVRKSLKQEKAS